MGYDEFFELVAYYFELFGKDFTVSASAKAFSIFSSLSSSYPNTYKKAKNMYRICCVS